MIQNLTHNAGLGDSDNECINFTLKCYTQGKDKINTCNYIRSDYITTRERLRQVNWVTELRGNFLTAYVNFLNVLETAMDGCIPKYKNVKDKNNIYITTEAIRKKDLNNKLWTLQKIQM